MNDPLTPGESAVARLQREAREAGEKAATDPNMDGGNVRDSRNTYKNNPMAIQAFDEGWKAGIAKTHNK